MREVSERAHAAGTKFILWFEPERVTMNSWLAANHPEWLLPRPGEALKLGPKDNRLLNLGDPRARTWLVDYLDAMFKSDGIDVLRTDFNFDPLRYWASGDAPDRQGLTENRYVTGLLAYWDELLRRDPERWIDTCASGGRRLDLETLRRAAPSAQRLHGQRRRPTGPYVWDFALAPVVRLRSGYRRSLSSTQLHLSGLAHRP